MNNRCNKYVEIDMEHDVAYQAVSELEDHARMGIVRALRRCGDMHEPRLARAVAAPMSATRTHLAALMERGVVEHVSTDRAAAYRLSNSPDSQAYVNTLLHIIS